MPVPFHSSLSESVTLQNLVNASQYNELRGTVQSTLRQDVSIDIDIDGETRILTEFEAVCNDEVSTMSKEYKILMIR